MCLNYPQIIPTTPQLSSMNPFPGALKVGDRCLEGGMEIRLLLHLLSQSKVHLLIFCVAPYRPLEVMSRPGDNIRGCTGVQMPKGVSRLCALGRGGC